MAWDPISGTFIQYSEDDVDASGFYLKFYASGTVTPISMADDSTGGTLLAKCALDADGMPINGSSAPFIPHIDQQYKIVIYRNAVDADADTIASAYKVIDELYPALSLESSDQFVNVYSTLNDAVTSDELINGQTLDIKERISGYGGGAMWSVVESSTVTENTFSVVQCTGVATLSLVLHESESVQLDQYGAVRDLDVAGIADTTDAGAIAAFIAASTDNHAAIEFALNHAISSHKELVGGGGGYYTSSRIIPTLLTNSEAFQNRAGNVKIKGQGITNTVFYTDAAQYIFDLTSGVTSSIDVVEVTDCMLWSPNGGGITTPDGMWRRYARVFFHGAAAGFYGRFDNGDAGAAYGVYMLDEEDCIYWNKNGYFGGAFSVNNFHTFNSKNAFISQNRYDGDVCKLEDGKSVSIPSIVLEAVPNEATPSNQSFLNLAGTTLSVDIGTMYVEGVWNRVIRNGAAADKNINIEMIYAWQRDISSFGDPECRIYSGQSSDAVNINKILYIADTTIAAPSTNMYLVEDNSIDDSRVSVNRFENQTASGGQSTRELKANVNAHRYNKGGFRTSKHIGVTINPGLTFSLDGPGAYIVNINFVSIDRNHGGTESFIVTYDDASANDFTNAVSIAAIAVKSGQFTSMAVTVDSAGLVTVTSVGLSQDWNVFYSVNILSALPLVNGTA